MEFLDRCYPQVRAVLEDAVPAEWPGLREAIGRLWEPPISTEAALPLAACRAVGGDPADAIHVTAALLAFSAAMRHYDDVEDQDRPEGLWARVGAARAFNYASATHALSHAILSRAPLSDARYRKVNQIFINGFFQLAAGQDRDLAGVTTTVEDYWVTVALKTGVAFSLACVCGAAVGTNDTKLIEACSLFGHHVGMTLQVFNDMDSIWSPSGITDLQQGKVTLPLVYATSLDHPRARELKVCVEKGNIADNAALIHAILDELDTRKFMVWAALREREHALEALATCPDNEGKAALDAYITGMFGDIEQLLEDDTGDESRHE